MIARTPGRDYVWPRRMPASDEQIGEYLLARRSLTRGEGYIQTSTFFVRRSLMLAQPFKSGQLKHQDTEWVLRMGRVPGAEVVFAEQVLAIHNIEEERVTVSSKSNWQLLARLGAARSAPVHAARFIRLCPVPDCFRGLGSGPMARLPVAAVGSPAPWQQHAARLCHLSGHLAAASPPPPPLARLDGAPPRAPCAGAFAMRILQLTRQFLPAQGGMESVVEGLSDRPAAQRAHGPGGDPSPALFDRCAGAGGVRRSRGCGAPHAALGSAPLPGGAGRTRAIRGYDLVHIHAIDFFVDYLSLLRWVHRIPLVVSTHGGFFHTQRAQAFKEWYFKTVTRQSLGGGGGGGLCKPARSRDVRQDCAPRNASG